MPALAYAPIAAPADPPAAPECPAAAFPGRSLDEYTRIFALDLLALLHRDVLDVAAGPASFTAEACARRIDAVAVDPFYGEPVGQLAARFERAAWLAASRPANQPAGRRRAFSRFEAAEADGRAAAQRFLQDYELSFPRGRYVAGSLPMLPFFDRTFDLVLCAHLLFRDAPPGDFDWHVAACRELVRVSAGEVRLHPLGGADGRPYPGLARLRRELRDDGITSGVIKVAGGFPPGTDTMLVLRRAES